MAPETAALIVASRVKKGDVLSVAQLGGIMGAERTSDLVPLCHLSLTSLRLILSVIRIVMLWISRRAAS